MYIVMMAHRRRTGSVKSPIGGVFLFGRDGVNIGIVCGLEAPGTYLSAAHFWSNIDRRRERQTMWMKVSSGCVV